MHAFSSAIAQPSVVSSLCRLYCSCVYSQQRRVHINNALLLLVLHVSCRHSNSHFARVLTSPRERFDRVQQLVRSGTKDAPSDQELGLLDLLQMPAKEFKDMYPAAALAQQTQ